MEKLNEEQLMEFKDMVDASRNGKLIGLCRRCRNTYQKREYQIMSDICDKCLSGVMIPKF